MVFDVKDFYPSISETLLKDTMHFAETVTQISQRNKEIIFYAHKSRLFNNEGPWIKKEENLFDVTMAFDCAEI